MSDLPLHVTVAPFPAALRKLALIGPLLIAAAAGTAQAQTFAQSGDTPQAWSARLAQLPVVLEGSLPAAYQHQMAEYLPGGMRSDVNLVDFTAAADRSIPNATTRASAALQTQPRVVLMFNVSDSLRAVDSCAVAPQVLSAAPPQGALSVRAALCDGTRTVSALQTALPQRDFGTSRAAATVRDLEARLVDQLPHPRNTVYGEPVTDFSDNGPTVSFPGG